MFANERHINEPVGERNRLPLDSLHRQFTTGTINDWKLCIRPEHCPTTESDGEMCLFRGC